MEINRIELVKNIDSIIGLVKTLRNAIQEEAEQLSLKDIRDLTDIIETRLINTINLINA